MDPNAVVLEISSDEDVDWNGQDGRGIADGGDDGDWLAELLDEVHKGNFRDDSDEVVVVSEVSPSEKPGKKSKLKSSVVDLDDDCVILDKDPDKPVEVQNNNPSNGEDDSDDIVVVSEKGQVACRDYPHPRHLCIKFPFSTTPNQSHCNQCYCYVCDSLAPCVYWGNGSATTDHCHATDKDELWKHERKNAKNGNKPVVSKVADVALFSGLHHPHKPAPAPVQPLVQVPRHGSSHARHPSAIFRPSDVLNQNRRHPVFASRSKLHPDLLQQYLLARRSGERAHVGYRHSITNSRRTGSVGVATAPNRHHPYPRSRGSLGNPNRLQSQSQSQSRPYSGSVQPNPVNPSVPYPVQSQQNHQTVNPQWPLQPQFSNHSNPSSSPFYQTPLVPTPARPDRAAGQPSYPVPAHAPAYPAPSQTRVDSLTISVSDYTQNQPDQVTQVIDTGVSWPAGPQEGSGPVNESSPLAVGPAGGLADYRYDWIFDNQPVEPGFLDGGPGSYGLTDFSSDSSFIDTLPIFDF